MAAIESIAHDGVRVEYATGGATFIGVADALIADWLILPDWLPALPKRARDSFKHPGWWGYDSTDDDRAPRVGHWALKRIRGGDFRFFLAPRHYRLFRGGPINPDATMDALAWHRRMVRARADEAFRRFLSDVTRGGAR